MLLCVICRCRELLNLAGSSFPKALCFVGLPCTRFLHILKLLGFISLRISFITSSSGMPNCSSMASKEVRSSQAISIIRSMSLSDRSSIYADNHCCLKMLFFRYGTQKSKFAEQNMRSLWQAVFVAQKMEGLLGRSKILQ